jgi:hypothetical protein
MAFSMGVFCPQSRAPTVSYLEETRKFIQSHQYLRKVAEDIKTLCDCYSFIAAKQSAIKQLPQAELYTKYLIQWLLHDDSKDVASTSSGIVALPRLVIIQVAQYFQFLDNQRLNHAGFIAMVRNAGGIQGYCGGLPAALALSCAKDEQEVVQMTNIAIHLAYVIGLYAELGDDSRTPGNTTIVIRLKKDGQGEELVDKFPGVSL